MGLANEDKLSNKKLMDKYIALINDLERIRTNSSRKKVGGSEEMMACIKLLRKHKDDYFKFLEP